MLGVRKDDEEIEEKGRGRVRRELWSFGIVVWGKKGDRKICARREEEGQRELGRGDSLEIRDGYYCLLNRLEWQLKIINDPQLISPKLQ